MTALLLAFLVPATQAAPRIVNGTEAGINDYPEVIGLLVDNGGTCTGSVIHPEWILTAAHCFDSISIDTFPSGNTQIIVGNSFTTPQRMVDTDLVIIHPEYVGTSGEVSLNGLGPFNLVDGYTSITNDIAIAHLAQPIPGTPMALNTEPIDEAWLSRELLEVGFGITVSGGGDSGTKRFARIPIIGFEPEWPTGDGTVTYFDADEGQGICQGDSGGPGMYETDAGYVQVGVTSTESDSCSIGNDMRVDLYIDWIEENSGIEVLKQAVRPPTFTCSHQLNPESANPIAIGVVPLDLQCLVRSAEPETIEDITWYWGDGSAPEVITDDVTARHVYDTMGVYNLRACISGTLAESEYEYENCILKSSHVNACSEPVASFEATPQDGLRIDVRNTTSLRAHNCVSNAIWEVYEGDTATGEPLLSLSGWEPNLDLEENGPGTYTVVLNVGGLGGTGGASATVDVGRGTGCSNTGLAPMLAPLAFLPLLGLRRRD